MRRTCSILAAILVAPLLHAACPDFAAAKTTPSGGKSPQALFTHDFNGDGRIDLAVLNTEFDFQLPVQPPPRLAILLGRGDGTFTLSPATYPLGVGAHSIAGADFNGDGRLDLAIASSNSSNITVLTSNGDGTMSSSTFAHPLASRLLAGDFDNDRAADLVVLRANGSFWFQRGLGNGTFGAPVQSQFQTAIAGAAIANVNGDARLDLVVTWDGHDAQALIGAGNGTFVASAPGRIPIGTGGGWIDAGDFDRDGKDDLAIAHGNNPAELTILLGNGAGGFGGPMKYTSGITANQLAVADLTQDGRPDVAVLNRGTDDVSVYVANANGTFAPAIRYATAGDESFDIAIADFNSDGKPDLAVVNAILNNVSVLLSRDTCAPVRRRSVNH